MSSKPAADFDDVRQKIAGENISAICIEELVEKYKFESLRRCIWEIIAYDAVIHKSELINIILDQKITPHVFTFTLVDIAISLKNIRLFRELVNKHLIKREEIGVIKRIIDYVLEVDEIDSFMEVLYENFRDDVMSIMGLCGQANPIVRVIKYGTVDKIKAVEKCGIDINMQDTGDYMFLHHSMNNFEVFKYILNHPKFNNTLFNMTRIVRFTKVNQPHILRTIPYLLNHPSFSGDMTFDGPFLNDECDDDDQPRFILDHLDKLWCTPSEVKNKEFIISEVLKFKERRRRVLVDVTELYLGPVSVINDYT